MPVHTLTPVTAIEQSSIVRCASCGATLDDRTACATCPNCGGLLAVEHTLALPSGEKLRSRFDDRLGAESYRGAAAERSGVWRFRELVIPGVRPEDIVSQDRKSGVEGK